MTLTMTLKIANQSFHMTVQPVMMHHHTKFGIKRFICSEYVILTNIHGLFELSL